MLGLGNSISASQYPGGWTPESVSNLQLWLKFNQNITADQDNTGGSIDHSTAAGNMEDADKINAWNAFGSTSINATQTTQGNKPLWETDAADVGSVKFGAGKAIGGPGGGITPPKEDPPIQVPPIDPPKEDPVVTPPGEKGPSFKETSMSSR